MKYYGYYGKITSHDGKRDELVDILLKASELLQKNAECFHYIVGTVDKNSIWVSELWSSKETHDSSLEPDEIRSLIMTARPLIRHMSNAIESEVYGGKGIPSRQTS